MLNETNYWSIPFGKWNGIPVRLHMLLFLAAAVIFGVEVHFLDDRPGMLGTAMVTVLLGATVVALHVMAQMAILRPYHQSVKTLCIVPWGGIYHLSNEVPHAIRSQALAFGVIANVMALLAGLTLLTPGSAHEIFNLLHPLRPRSMDWQNLNHSLLQIFVWLNFALCVANMIPIVPFDMGYMLEYYAARHLRDVEPIHRFTMLLAVGQIFSLGLFFIAYLVRDWTDGPLRPAWLWPVMLGIFLFFSARQHYLRRFQEALPPANFHWRADLEQQAFVQAENYHPPAVSAKPAWEESLEETQWDQWMKEHHHSRLEAVQAQEETEDQLLDKILHKVGESGMESLTIDERELLNRVSQRYRNRRPTQQSS